MLPRLLPRGDSSRWRSSCDIIMVYLGMSRVRGSSVDSESLKRARQARSGLADSALLDEALGALLAIRSDCSRASRVTPITGTIVPGETDETAALREPVTPAPRLLSSTSRAAGRRPAAALGRERWLYSPSEGRAPTIRAARALQRVRHPQVSPIRARAERWEHPPGTRRVPAASM